MATESSPMNLLALVMWLCTPALVVTIAAQLWLFRRRRALQTGQAVRVVIALGRNSLTGTNPVTALLGDSAASVATRAGVSGGTVATSTILLARNPRV